MPARGWDYVVIGAGAAGCVVAGRLSQTLPEARIALIEAGRERLGVTTRVPGIAFIASTFPRQNWNYQTEPVPALNGRRLSWFQGRIHRESMVAIRRISVSRTRSAPNVPWISTPPRKRSSQCWRYLIGLLLIEMSHGKSHIARKSARDLGELKCQKPFEMLIKTGRIYIPNI